MYGGLFRGGDAPLCNRADPEVQITDDDDDDDDGGDVSKCVAKVKHDDGDDMMIYIYIFNCNWVDTR
jgi:hypothetical protein